MALSMQRVILLGLILFLHHHLRVLPGLDQRCIVVPVPARPAQ